MTAPETIEILEAEAATADALDEIAGLLAAVFPRPRSWLEDLRWQYLANPNGPAWFVNARAANGELVAHYGVAALPRLADDKLAGLTCFLSLNTAVHPRAQGRGLFKATAQRLFARLEDRGPTVILGVANANSAPGFTRSLGFFHLGRLDLRFYPPFTLPRSDVPRALLTTPEQVRWRVRRPLSVVRSVGDAILARIEHKHVPLDNVLTSGIAGAEVGPSMTAAPRLPWLSALPAPRLYASFGCPTGGLPVPERLRPSPLHFICRPLPDRGAAAVVNHLVGHRFEFFDFDVT